MIYDPIEINAPRIVTRTALIRELFASTRWWDVRCVLFSEDWCPIQGPELIRYDRPIREIIVFQFGPIKDIKLKAWGVIDSKSRLVWQRRVYGRRFSPSITLELPPFQRK